MFDEHLLSDYEGGYFRARFAANPKMADAWYRLQEGTPRPSDAVLLQHELVEARFLQSHPGATYQEAHEAANRVADWDAMTTGKD